MGLIDIFKSIGAKKGQRTLASMLNNEPVFVQFGNDIYASDIVQCAIDTIATEFSKMQLQHIRLSTDGKQEIVNSSIQKLFTVSPNPYMTTRDFLEQTMWQLEMNYNSFVYLKYDIYEDTGGILRKNYTAAYPLNPTQVDFEEDSAGRMFIRFRFAKGFEVTLPYSEVIHLRKKFSSNSIMGGGINGQPVNDSLLKMLETDDIVIQGLGKAVKTSLALRGILKANTTLNDEAVEAERAKLEKALANNDSSILAMDLKASFENLSLDPKFVDKDTLDFIDRRILRWYRTSSKIIEGNYTDEEGQAFYESVIEPRMITYAQAFTKCLFNDREIAFGNRINMISKDAMFISYKTRLDLLKIGGEQGLLTNDQKLTLIGYPPIGGDEGAKRTQSLNYVDTNLVNDYQMAKASAPQINANKE